MVPLKLHTLLFLTLVCDELHVNSSSIGVSLHLTDFLYSSDDEYFKVA